MRGRPRATRVGCTWPVPHDDGGVTSKKYVSNYSSHVFWGGRGFVKGKQTSSHTHAHTHPALARCNPTSVLPARRAADQQADCGRVDGDVQSGAVDNHKKI